MSQPYFPRFPHQGHSGESFIQEWCIHFPIPFPTCVRNESIITQYDRKVVYEGGCNCLHSLFFVVGLLILKSCLIWRLRLKCSLCIFSEKELGPKRHEGRVPALFSLITLLWFLWPVQSSLEITRLKSRPIIRSVSVAGSKCFISLL